MCSVCRALECGDYRYTTHSSLAQGAYSSRKPAPKLPKTGQDGYPLALMGHLCCMSSVGGVTLS